MTKNFNKIYLLQLDLISSSPNPQITTIIESFGDFVIHKNNFIINTNISKQKIINKFKKVLTKDEQIFIKEIQENELGNFPFIIKNWHYNNLQEQNENNQEIYKLAQQEALNKLNSLLDTVKDELDKQIFLKEGG